MSAIHLNIPSFNAGELSPLLGSRFAVEKVAAGCRRLRNFYIHVHGPAFRRPGMEYMGPAASNATKSRLEGFNFSTSTGFILELSATGLRVWSNGLQVPLQTPVVLPYTEAECFEVQMMQVNDVTYMAHPNHAPQKLVRHADDDWRLEEIIWKWPALGDENVRSGSIATPTATELVEIDTYNWPEITLPSGAFSFAITTPDTSGTTKTATIQYINAGAWVTAHTFTWTTSGPSAWVSNFGAAKIVRMTYSGPIAPSGGKMTIVQSVFTRLQVLLDTFQPQDNTEVSMPAGEWQAFVDATAVSTVPAGASLTVQKKIDGVWVDAKTLTITAGEVTQYRAPALLVDRLMRFNWAGRAMMGGTASLEKLEYPVSTDITVAVDATNGPGRTMTASEAIFKAGHIGGTWQIVHRRDAAFVQIVADVTTITTETTSALRVSGRWDVTSYGTWAATLYLEQKIQGSWEVLRSWSSRKDRNIIASGTEDEESEMRLRISGGTSEAASGAAVPRFILEATNARAYGLVKITDVGSLDAEGKSTTATVDVVSTLYSTAATPLWTEGSWSTANGFPRAVALHGQRLWFGGTTAEPQRLWGSAASDYENFRRTSLDDASVSFTPAAQQSNAIQWMASHERELVIGTSGDEWTLAPAEGGIVTPVSAVMQRRSAYGSAYLPPIMLGEGLVFVQRGGRKLRQILAHSDAVVWSASDLMVLAEHLSRLGIVQTAAMSFPLTILWAVTTDGKLLGMTFETEQNVFGWHVHETDGLVESVAVVHGELADEVWITVLRGAVRTIERLDPVVFAQRFDAPARLMYVDAGLRVESETELSVVSGLGHLEGKLVSIVGDGAELTPQTVTGGSVTLSSPASTVIVGLPYTSELQPMRMDIPLPGGTAQGKQFRVARAMLSVYSTMGGSVAHAPEGRFESLNFRQVSTEVGQPPALFTGNVETSLTSSARDGVDVTVRQTGPLPLNLISITVKLDAYGD